LTPLPPIARPSTSTVHAPTSTIARPIEKPELPARWKGKGKEDCLDIFNGEGEWNSEEKYDWRAIKISGPGMTVWATMRSEEVGGVKFFLRVRQIIEYKESVLMR